MAALLAAGTQVPVKPLVEVVGKAASAAPLQMGAMGAKVGTGLGLTKIVKVGAVAHCPGSGVKVYVVVAVLFRAGDQVPV